MVCERVAPSAPTELRSVVTRWAERRGRSAWEMPRNDMTEMLVMDVVMVMLKDKEEKLRSTLLSRYLYRSERLSGHRSAIRGIPAHTRPQKGR